VIGEPAQVLLGEVAYTHGTGPARRVDLLEGAPGVEVSVFGGHGPMDQVEIDNLQAQPLHALVERPKRGVVTLTRIG